jgi:lipid II:glycine glycyltransferase (peptidoglycan interpeptide bridge formation enzyme)
MTASIKSLEQIGAEAWDRFIERHPLAGVYHHAGWHETIERTYGYKGSYCIIEGANDIEAALPFVLVNNPPLKKRLVSYPYSDACDPLVKSGEELRAITEKMEEYRTARGARSTEIRTYRLFEKVPHGIPAGAPRYHNYVLDLRKDTKALFRSFHRDCVQRAIKKAKASSVEVVEAQTFDDMKDFYRLHISTRKRLGVPVQPFRFFRNLWETLHPLKMVSLLVAREQGRAIAGVVQLKFKDSVYYKFAAADRQFLAKRPNHLIIWSMIQNAVEEGFSYLDFGRTYVGDEGLMQWKMRWGTEQKDFNYLYPSDSGGNRFNQQGAAANAILNGVLQKMPCFVVRLSGELFYRYLA